MSDLLQMGVLSAVAVACGLLGPFLVLRRMTMFANSLSHTILLGIACAFLVAGSALHLGTLLIGAALAALMTAFCTGVLVRTFRLQEDASIGLVFTSLFALGIIVVTLYLKNVHLGLESVMGNADILQGSDLQLALSLCGINLACVTLFYKPLKLGSFDPNLSKVFRIPTLQFLLLFLTAATCIGAFRAVGVLLVLSFLVGPFLTARLFFHRLPTLLVATPLIGVLASILGVLISRLFFDGFGISLSTGGIVSTLIGLIYVGAKWVDRFICKKPLPS
ncbi:MAG: metal ABC transporter permease [Verrucomicrobia bacterium]|nr:metal ABC transporter permease [Verrucomicrobiota bacterium]MBU6446993.1 metal ABC transporter permease [Verrucomicrobiota bacterium]MDE3047002.1 metal ABC transporter permease [Verrucomicrobiota bacterium]